MNTGSLVLQSLLYLLMKSEKNNDETFDLGTRKVTPMNFSMVCPLPKIYTDNYLGDKKEVQITMCGGKLILEPVTDTEKKK